MLKLGQRWALHTNCHSFIVEVIEVESIRYASGQVIQVLKKDNFCSLDLSIGRKYGVTPENSDWEYLDGQDAP